jgi:thiamine biosynthesis protein ThiI
MTKALSLISSGIDSPVSTYIMMKKGLDVSCVHFDNQPFTDKRPREKAIKQVEYLSKLFNKQIKLYIVKHGKNQAEFMRNTNRRYGCIFCRRTMLKVAEKIAKTEGCEFLITGENLGQVASQTLDNLAATDSAVNIPILRPLLTNDKQETIDIARKIGTFEVSIEKGVCCHAVPKKPVTKAKQNMVEEEEKRVDVQKIVDDAVSTAEVMMINP